MQTEPKKDIAVIKAVIKEEGPAEKREPSSSVWTGPAAEAKWDSIDIRKADV